MSATTIAEFEVGDDAVRVDLEIGAADLLAFVNILPDELLEKLVDARDGPDVRARRFFQEDLVVIADGRELAGTAELVEVRPRIARDAVTGEPLAVQPADREIIVHVVAAWPLTAEPGAISIRPPLHDKSQLSKATIGFTLFHRGLPVTDFRYLGKEETVDLNWADPWYSKFRNPNLKRHFDAPISVFLYVEHFEVRVEVVARPRDLQLWMDLEVGDRDILPVSEQPLLMERVSGQLLKRLKLNVNGQSAALELDRIHFVRRTLRQTGVVEPPEPMNLTSATLGVILVRPLETLPDQVELTWPLFSERISAIPVVATDQAGGLPGTITADDPVLVWQNFLTNPIVPGMLEIPAPKTSRDWEFLVPSIAALLAACGTGLMLFRKSSRPATQIRRMWIPVAVGLLVAVVVSALPRVAIPFTSAGAPMPDAADRSELVHSLLHHIYRAFDRRSETIVFDQLELSVSGDLLEEVYLEFRKALELANQGGAQASVEEVNLISCEASPAADGGGFLSRTTWAVSGAVGHWGHIHRRVNQYTADLTIAPHENRWKITGLRIVESAPVEATPLPNG